MDSREKAGVRAAGDQVQVETSEARKLNAKGLAIHIPVGRPRWNFACDVRSKLWLQWRCVNHQRLLYFHLLIYRIPRLGQRLRIGRYPQQPQRRIQSRPEW